MADSPECIRLDGAELTLVFALSKGVGAQLAYCGPMLPPEERLADLESASQMGWHESQPDTPPRPGLLTQRQGGWAGTPAVQLRERAQDLLQDPITHFTLSEWDVGENEIWLEWLDQPLGLRVEQWWTIRSGDVVSSRSEITNLGERNFFITRQASLVVPIPARFSEMITFSGRWASEMRESRSPIYPNGFHGSSAIGKPGFGGGNWLLLEAPASGEVLGAHLAWSGDYDTRIECDADGRAVLQMTADWDASEVPLPTGTSFESAEAMFALASNRSTLAQKFHDFVRSDVLPDRSDWGPRKVHLNSWEALGFDLSEDKLKALADSAAALGIERFVLDDGWFGGRRNDRTSLGDWFVSPDVLPNGLDPLIKHFHGLGMDFGLWVEPEMVSPDSELYRAHPDWCLHVEGQDRPTMRGQLVLDLTRDEVIEYLIERLDALLNAHDIAYLKWDHNRDLFPAQGVHGAVRFNQTSRLYYLLNHLRAKHPEVEIETCSSGGGRIDFGVLSRTHRVWPSDNNDAIERVRIMRAWSQFLPLEVLGSHVGPSPNPITGRQLNIDFRAKIALFGHMGVEADPAVMEPAEQETLKAHIALYKQWRGLLHKGRLHRLDHGDDGFSGLMVSDDNQGLALVAQTQLAERFQVSPVRLAGLDSSARYSVTLPQPWPPKAALYLVNHARWLEGFELSGQALMSQGLQLPLTRPETAWLIALERLEK